MAKRGRKSHTKRIAAPDAIPVQNKKEQTWIANTSPGPHPKKKSMPLVVLLREVLGAAESSQEAKAILNDRKVLVDGVARTDHKFPIGFMDIISMPAADAYYRIGVKRGKLSPEKIGKKDAEVKLLKVTGKNTVKGNKISIAFHDGKNLVADNNVKVGDTIEFDLKEGKLAKLHKFGKGAKCIITDGKHSGTEVVVEDIYPNEEGRPAEALVGSGEGETFRTLAGYLFVLGGQAELENKKEEPGGG
ncbi:30S ribosomal protein S4e [Candidatus Micrarchaeota archaeon]|nr:30S ribosomal protein S4e [Candidatus Micrarchaeota archaeon]MBD3418280.1 30S ribosomal protein S4e [Candidatus Micrarchaeota archaeon]